MSVLNKREILEKTFEEAFAIPQVEESYINELKKEYNTYLMRHFKAAIYLDDNNIPLDEREQWLPEYKNILDNLNRILNQLDIYEATYSANEVLGGFNIDELMKKGA